MPTIKEEVGKKVYTFFMKLSIRIVVLLLMLISLHTSPLAWADTIIQGNAESHTSVTTNIQGSGSVSTHIESTVNGNTKTLDSSKPGTYTLNNSSSGSTTVITQPPATISPLLPTATPSATPFPHISQPIARNHDASFLTVLLHIRDFFRHSIQNMLTALHI